MGEVLYSSLLKSTGNLSEGKKISHSIFSAKIFQYFQRIQLFLNAGIHISQKTSFMVNDYG